MKGYISLPEIEISEFLRATYLIDTNVTGQGYHLSSFIHKINIIRKQYTRLPYSDTVCI